MCNSDIGDWSIYNHELVFYCFLFLLRFVKLLLIIESDLGPGARHCAMDVLKMHVKRFANTLIIKVCIFVLSWRCEKSTL